MGTAWENLERGLAASSTGPELLLAFDAALRKARAGTEGREPSPPAPVDAADHVRGPAAAPHVILEYGDYQCPYSRAAGRQIQRVALAIGERVRFAFRHFPLTDIHPYALPASAAAEAAAAQDRFWDMHDRLFAHQDALADAALTTHAEALGLDVARFDADRHSAEALDRIARDAAGGVATGLVRGTPTLFVDGGLYVGRHDARSLIEHLGTLG